MGDGKKDAYEAELTAIAGHARLGMKDSNPKDVAGSARIDLSLVPVVALIEEALAFEEGGTKYGYYNYTVVGVKARVYVSAALRHLFKWLLGEERDPKTGVHHLGSVRACMGILIDAQARGKLSDDRPPSLMGASDRLDSMEARVRKVRELFKGHSPRHYTIEDTEHVNKGTGEQIHRERAPAAAEGRVPREDAQPVPGWDARRVVQREARPVGGVQVDPARTQERSNYPRTEPSPAEVAEGPKGGRA